LDVIDPVRSADIDVLIGSLKMNGKPLNPGDSRVIKAGENLTIEADTEVAFLIKLF
jgi:hypothetical protein